VAGLPAQVVTEDGGVTPFWVAIYSWQVMLY